MSGKGSAPRPFSVTEEQFAEAWERIFRKDKDGQGESHPELNSERREPDCQGQGTAQGRVQQD